MKKFLFLLSLVTSLTNGQVLVPDSQSSQVEFEIKNFGVTVVGSFSGLTGIVQFDPNQPGISMINLSVQASTIETGIYFRDKHLKEEGFFDVEQNPELKIFSVAIRRNNSDGYFFTGYLTIKGITKEISFPFTIVPSKNGFDFAGMFVVNRRDFGVGEGSLTMSDDVLVRFHIQTLKRLP